MAKAECVVQDDRGRKIRLEHPAERIVALYGAFNEMLAALGQEQRIVARTQADDRPASILDKPVIGTHLRPNAERILALDPDLVLQMAGRAEALEQAAFLEKLGLNVAIFRLETFAQLQTTMTRLGELTGAAAQGRAFVARTHAALDRIRTGHPIKKPRIFFEVRHPNLLTVGQKSMVTEIITAAGGINCVSSPDKLLRLSEEELLRLDPDIYLMQRGPMNPVPAPLEKRPHFSSLRCLRQGQVFTVDQHLFSRPGPRSLDAVRHMADIINHWAQERP